MVNNEELIGTAGYQTLYTRSYLNCVVITRSDCTIKINFSLQDFNWKFWRQKFLFVHLDNI
jgi:hypothetical protein